MKKKTKEITEIKGKLIRRILFNHPFVVENGDDIIIDKTGRRIKKKIKSGKPSERFIKKR